MRPWTAVGGLETVAVGEPRRESRDRRPRRPPPKSTSASDARARAAPRPRLGVRARAWRYAPDPRTAPAGSPFRVTAPPSPSTARRRLVDGRDGPAAAGRDSAAPHRPREERSRRATPATPEDSEIPPRRAGRAGRDTTGRAVRGTRRTDRRRHWRPASPQTRHGWRGSDTPGPVPSSSCGPGGHCVPGGRKGPRSRVAHNSCRRRRRRPVTRGPSASPPVTAGPRSPQFPASASALSLRLVANAGRRSPLEHTVPAFGDVNGTVTAAAS